jgi:phosphoglycerol transferase MdoB-like AlkP superfamily enzyme
MNLELTYDNLSLNMNQYLEPMKSHNVSAKFYNSVISISSHSSFMYPCMTCHGKDPRESLLGQSRRCLRDFDLNWRYGRGRLVL